MRLEYRIPARGLIGFTNEFLNLTRGSGLISNIFDRYEPHKGDIGGRKNGVLISMDDGANLHLRPGQAGRPWPHVREGGRPRVRGMIVGIHSRDNDLVVNATRTKQLTNFRVSGKEDAIKITPDRPHAGVRCRVHRRRRTGRNHAQVGASAQALFDRNERKRASRS